MKKILYEFNKEEVELLKSLINKSIISYSYGKDEMHKDMTMGNMLLNIDNNYYEITNYEEPMVFFDSEEEVNNFSIKSINSSKDFSTYIQDIEIVDKIVNQKIDSIEIVKDTITLTTDDYEYIIDRAIIFHLSNKEDLIISTGWYFGEFIYILQNENNIYSIENVIDDWKFDDESKIVDVVRNKIAI